MTSINATQLKLSSLFKYAYLANLAIFLPVAILFGLLGSAGHRTVQMNGEQVYGIQAVIVSAALPFLIALAPALWIVLGTLVLRLLGKRGPNIRARANAADGEGAAPDA